MEAKARCRAREVTLKNVLSTEIQIPALTCLVRQADWLVCSHSTRRMETGDPRGKADFRESCRCDERPCLITHYIYDGGSCPKSAPGLHTGAHTCIPSHTCTPSRGNMHATYMYLNEQLNVNKSGHVFFSAC